MQTEASPDPTPQPTAPVKFRMVCEAPAPRTVTFDLFSRIPEDRLYVPALRNTTCPEGQFWIALLICDTVAPGFIVAQTVVLVGMPPAMPACDQSIARLGLSTPFQFCPKETEGATNKITVIATKIRPKICSTEKKGFTPGVGDTT